MKRFFKRDDFLNGQLGANAMMRQDKGICINITQQIKDCEKLQEHHRDFLYLNWVVGISKRYKNVENITT
jgi:hypothetical protein